MTRRNRLFATLMTCAAAALTLGLHGCGTDDDPIFGSDTTEVAWTITDACADGSSIELRFHDEVSGEAFPSATEVYIIPSDLSRALKFRCQIGNPVCFGGDTSPPSGETWGVGLDGTGSCADCCEICEIGLSVSDSLPCP